MNNKIVYVILGIMVLIILVIVIRALRLPISEISTANWDIHKNSDYGYELKYPDDWAVDIAVTPRSEQSIPEWIKNNLTDYKKIREREVDNSQATLLAGASNNVVAVFPHGDWLNRDEVVSVTYTSTPKESLVPVVYAGSLEEKMIELEQILTTFKFTDNKDLTIISPTPGQIWTAGETYEIRWKPSNPTKKVGIQLYDTAFLYSENPLSRSSSLAKVWTETVQDTGKYEFTVPVGILTENQAQTGGVFQIYVGGEDGYGYSPLIAITQADREFGKPMIEEITGLTEVPVGEQATWFIRARDPQGGILTDYTASWGDGSACTLVSCGPQDKSDFSHIFNAPGTYQVKFGVSNSQGLRGFKTIEIIVTEK